MKCPQCNNEQYCPCINCKETHSKGKQTWIWVNGDSIKCSFCGLTKHADFWETEAWKQHKQLKAKKERKTQMKKKSLLFCCFKKA